MTALQEALDYADERGSDLIEFTPHDVGADQRTMIHVIGERQQMLVEVGWGAAGLFADVRIFVDDEPVTPRVFHLDSNVTVQSPPL